jgi:hypothetical protein
MAAAAKSDRPCLCFIDQPRSARHVAQAFLLQYRGPGRRWGDPLGGTGAPLALAGKFQAIPVALSWCRAIAPIPVRFYRNPTEVRTVDSPETTTMAEILASPTGGELTTRKQHQFSTS